MFDMPVATLGPLKLEVPRVMGIVNATPDSFSDGGRHDPLAHALALVDEGADLVDVGGESTRPGATPVSAADEIARVVTIVAALAKRGVVVSIDTSKPEVMRAAVDAGAAIVNDVRALRVEGAVDAVSRLGVPVILAHMRGEPGTMQDAPHYDDVVGDVHRYLADRILSCELAGIAKRHIAIDPGFGFGKSLEHNLALFASLRRFTELGVPLLVGVSRKGMIGAITGRALDQRAHGSAAAALMAVQRGAAIVRVHDVAATKDALAVLAAIGAERAAKPASKPKISLFDDE